MILTKKFKPFDDVILNKYPDLREFLKPSDYYPELKNIIKNRSSNLPVGSLNTRVIINDGEIVERVFKTPKGQFVSLFSNPSNITFDQAA